MAATSVPQHPRLRFASMEERHIAIACALADLMPLAEREYEERKIACNEGRYDPKSLEALRVALEKNRETVARYRARGLLPTEVNA